MIVWSRSEGLQWWSQQSTRINCGVNSLLQDRREVLVVVEIFEKLVVVVGLSFHTQSSPCIPREAVGRKSKHPVRHILSY
jgi:hypothetical protein